MNCCYCDKEIDRSGLDWGLTLVDYSHRYWHMECFEIYETAVLEEL